MKDTIFSKIIAGEIPSYTVYEDEHVLAFLDIFPKTKGHTLVIPKEPFDNLYDISDEALAQVSRVAKRIAIHMKEALGASGVNIFQSSGSAAQQEVMHYHMHVVPRYDDDQKISFATSYEGKEFEAIAATLSEGLA